MLPCHPFIRIDFYTINLHAALLPRRNMPILSINKFNDTVKYWHDSRLSWKAKGMLHYLLSLEDQSITDVDVLTDMAYEKVGVVRKILKQLEDHGYLVRVRKRNRQMLAEMIWHIAPSPQNELFITPKKMTRI